MELDHSLLCHFSHILGSTSQGFLETLKLDDPEDLKKSKGSGKTGSLGDRTMRELSLEDWDTLWNYMKLLWQLWINKDFKCQTGLIHQHSSICRSRFDMPPETQLRCFRCLIHFNHLDEIVSSTKSTLAYALVTITIAIHFDMFLLYISCIAIYRYVYL